MADSPIGGLVGAAIGLYALGAINKQFNSMNKYKCYMCGRKATHMGIAHDVWGNPKTVPVCDDYPHCSYKSGKLF